MADDDGYADPARAPAPRPAAHPVGWLCRCAECQDGTTQGKTKGYDAGKQVHGRKRHVLVDTIGLVMRILVTAADCDDRDGLRGLLSAYFAGGVQRLKKLWVAALKHSHKIDLEVVAKPAAGFAVLPRRWVVERTFAWLVNFRRHSKDYEVLPRNREALIQIAMIHLLLKRRAMNAQF